MEQPVESAVVLALPSLDDEPNESESDPAREIEHEQAAKKTGRMGSDFGASPKTQLCLLLALLFPTGILVAGIYSTDRIIFAPPLNLLSGSVREAMLHRYLKVPLLSFFGFFGAAGTQFKKTRRRLF